MSDKGIGNFYFVVSRNSDRMLLYSLPELPDDWNDDWLNGRQFGEAPEEPVRVMIREGNEDGVLLPFFDSGPLISIELYEALIEIGVDNIVAYDAVIHSDDDTVVYEGYKAINVIGLVKAAGPGTVYVGDSRLINASIDELDFEPQSVNGLLLFRMAENVADIVVSEKVKSHIERKNFHSIEFIPVGDCFTL